MRDLGNPARDCQDHAATYIALAGHGTNEQSPLSERDASVSVGVGAITKVPQGAPAQKTLAKRSAIQRSCVPSCLALSEGFH